MKASDILWVALLVTGAAALLTGGLLLSGCGKDKPQQEKTATLRFRSFDGGGPSYDFFVENDSIVSLDSRREYDKPNHEELDGAGYDGVLTLTGKKAGETVLTVTGDSPVAEVETEKYRVTVAKDLSVTAERLDETADSAEERQLIVIVSGHSYYAIMADNASADALWKEAETRHPHVDLHAEGDMPQKRGTLETDLPASKQQDGAHAGELVLYGSSEIAVCYGDCEGECTLLATLTEYKEDDLQLALESDPATLILMTQWPER